MPNTTQAVKTNKFSLGTANLVQIWHFGPKLKILAQTRIWSKITDVGTHSYVLSKLGCERSIFGYLVQVRVREKQKVQIRMLGSHVGNTSEITRRIRPPRRKPLIKEVLVHRRDIKYRRGGNNIHATSQFYQVTEDQREQ